MVRINPENEIFTSCELIMDGKVIGKIDITQAVMEEDKNGKQSLKFYIKQFTLIKYT